MVLTYIADALWVIALAIMFGASRQAAGRVSGPTVRLSGADLPKGLVLWALPVAAFLISLALAFHARTADLDDASAFILFGVRAVLASLAALAHLRLLAGALKP